MKGLISGIKRMEIHDGDGLRTTVFFKGCPLRCIWCHNPESLSFLPDVAFFKNKCISCGACEGKRDKTATEKCPADALMFFGREYSVKELVSEILMDSPFFGKCGGVTLSGGECLSQPDFAIALARELRENGVGVYVDTCGYVKREVFEKIMPYTDKFLYDIKAYDPELHKRYTGRYNTLILDNLRFLSEAGCKIEVRYPLVRGYNDGECEKIGRYLSNLPKIEAVRVLKYHNFASSRYDALGIENTLPQDLTEPEDVANAVKLLQGLGLCALNGME